MNSRKPILEAGEIYEGRVLTPQGVPQQRRITWMEGEYLSFKPVNYIQSPFYDKITKGSFRVWMKKLDICQNNHGGNPESQKANRYVDKVSQRKLICEALARRAGLMCEQLEDITFLKHQSCSARISELKRDGLIEKCGTGKTRSGSSAALYKLV